MAYVAPAEFVTRMVDAGESKLLMSTRDTLIRAYMAGAILALAAAFAVSACGLASGSARKGHFRCGRRLSVCRRSLRSRERARPIHEESMSWGHPVAVDDGPALGTRTRLACPPARTGAGVPAPVDDEVVGLEAPHIQSGTDSVAFGHSSIPIWISMRLAGDSGPCQT